ncbi:hypothetical protein MRX96_004002 [Rhipicephalus microplus]
MVLALPRELIRPRHAYAQSGCDPQSTVRATQGAQIRGPYIVSTRRPSVSANVPLMHAEMIAARCCTSSCACHRRHATRPILYALHAVIDSVYVPGVRDRLAWKDEQEDYVVEVVTSCGSQREP